MRRLQIPLWKTKALNLGGLGAEPPNQKDNELPGKRKERKSVYILIFPFTLIVLDVGAAIVYLLNKDYKKAVYWFAAAVLNICVTF